MRSILEPFSHRQTVAKAATGGYTGPAVPFDDDDIRAAAMAQCRRLVREYGDAVPWAAIQTGFSFGEARVFLGSTPRGIHRPVQMQRGVLSIRTTKPKAGRPARYDDQVHRDGYFTYAFQGDNPRSHDNTALREAFEDQTPLIYFYAITPGRYDILFPCYIMAWDPERLMCDVAVGDAGAVEVPTRLREGRPVIDRGYTTRLAKVRLHQAEFREAVLDAYGQRCAVSGLPIPELLEAAHIIPDHDERGRPDVANGICLSQLHHRAYDRQLLGIDPDGIIHIARSVLEQRDGPTLEYGLKACHRQQLRLPTDERDFPNREYLAERFRSFQRTA